MLLMLYNAGIVLFLNTENPWCLIMCVLMTLFILLVMLIFKKLYKKVSFSLVNNMCMLLCISQIILTRLDPEAAVRQFAISLAAFVICCLVPLFIYRAKALNSFTWVYAIVGVLGLLAARLLGHAEYGAYLSIRVAGVSFQPAEIIKIIFVFFVACRLSKFKSRKDIIITTGVALLHVLILVVNRDLGAAVIFLLTYLIMLYVATGRMMLFFGGLGVGAIAGVAAYFLFSHVRTRVIAWQDPLAVADGAGYQVSQSLFAIGTGGWFGTGLCEGMPQTIPVVTEDYIFSAISEELGGVFALCLIFVCISIFIMFLNVGMLIRHSFYKLLALGLGCVYGIQVFVAIGGVIKLIPATGITLPLISYGGSSLLGTMVIFAIIQGLYVYREREELYE